MRGLPLLFLGAGAVYFASRSKSKKKKQDDLPDVTDGGGEEVDEEPEELADDDDELDEEMGEAIDEFGESETGVDDDDLDINDPDPIDEPGPQDALPDVEIPTPAVKPKRPPRGPEAPNEPVGAIYSAEPVFMPPEIANELTADSAATLPENRFYFYLAPRIQSQLFNRFVKRFKAMADASESPTLPEVVAREELNKINSGEDWGAPVEDFSKAKTLAWYSALGLARLATVQTGFAKILGKELEKVELFRSSPNMYTVMRESLGMPNLTMRSKQDKDLIAVDQRVELLAVSQDKEHAEHIIGRVSDLAPNGDPEKIAIEVIDTFQGVDTTPQLTAHHGFGPGSLGIFNKRSPSGVYRVFPKGLS